MWLFRKSEMLMCGICGIVGKRTSENVMRDMLDAIAHRGPDDEGIFKEGDILDYTLEVTDRCNFSFVKTCVSITT